MCDNNFERSVEWLSDKAIQYLYLGPIKTELNWPVFFIVNTPVMNAKHDGEGACWEQFLDVVVVSVVVETVRCCEGKSVPDLKKTI